MAAIIVGAISLGVVLNESSADTVIEQPSDSASTIQSYGFRVYALNCTGIVDTGSGTLLTFDERELPFDFSEIKFGDFRLDADIVDSYYGGICLAVSTSGQSGNLTFREQNGKHVQDIRYQGQPLVALNGWEYISRDDDGRIIDHRWGSMQIAAYDWSDGKWCPSEGILVEKPDYVTISNAALYLMVFEPSSTTSIPEFDLIPGCAAGIAAIVILRKVRRIR